MATFQTALTTMTPPQPNMDPPNDSESQQSESQQFESHSAETEVTRATNHESNNGARQDEPTKNLTRTPPANLWTQPDPNLQQPSANESTHEKLTHQKPVSTGATPPSKRSRSAKKLRLESRQLKDEFEEVQTFQSTDNQSAASGESQALLASAHRSVCDTLFTPLLGGTLCCVQQNSEPSQSTTRPLCQQGINFTTPARRQNQNNAQAKNNCWGDFLGPEHPEHFRAMLQSPNRVSARDDFTDFQRLCQGLCSHQTDLIALPESGLD